MSNDFVLVQISDIHLNPFQPATGLDPEKVSEIAESLKGYRDNGSKGLLQVPIARRVNGHYELAFGRHRLQAFKKNCEEGDVFFADMPLLVRELSDEDMYALMLSENIERRGISLVEIGEIFHDYMTKFNKKSVETAEKFHKSEEYVRSAIRTLNLPEDAKQALQAGEINVTTSRELLTLKKLAGDVAVTSALKSIKGDDFHGSPQDAIERTLHMQTNVVEMHDAGWLQTKKFPRQYLNALSTKDAEEIIRQLLGAKEVDAPLQTESDRLLHILRDPSMTITAEAFPLLAQHAPENFERLLSFVNLPACTACPLHAVFDGDHFCGIKMCFERKQAAWQKKVIDDKAKELGIKLYVNEKTDGPKVDLSTNVDADRKLFKERHEDLRLVPINTPRYWNFDGVPTNLKVVVVGKTAEKRLKAETEQKEKSTKESKERDAEIEARRLDGEISDLKSNSIDQFQWEVAAPLFASALDGIGDLPLLKHFMEHMIDGNWDGDFPPGVDGQFEQMEQAETLKKADQLKLYRRLIMFHSFTNMIQFHDEKFNYSHVMKAKKPVIALAEYMQTLAAEWGVKPGVAFMKSAEKYQADLDQAIKNLRAEKK